MQASAKTVMPLKLKNLCAKTHKLRVSVKGQSFVRVITDAEPTIVGGGTVEARFEVDTTGTKAGSYKGRVMLSCMDCSTNEVCNRGELQLRINILEKKSEVTEVQPDQARLFDLIREGRYQEAIAGFAQRVKQKRGDSRDYYGLAVTHEQLKDYKQAVLNANKALSFNQNDRRLSKEEQNDARRIAEGREK